MKINYTQELTITDKITNMAVGDLLIDDGESSLLIISVTDDKDAVMLFDIENTRLLEIRYTNIDELRDDILVKERMDIWDVIKKENIALKVNWIRFNSLRED